MIDNWLILKRKERNRLDKLRVSAFQMLFELRKEEDGIDTAFADSIIDTSDEKFEQCLKERPELVEQWLKEHGKKKKLKIIL